MSLFQSMGAFARKTKVVRMAAPEDIIGEEKVWSLEELSKPILQRGAPQAFRLQIRKGAPTMDFEIRPLSMTERDAAERILDAVMPQPLFIEELPQRPGDMPRRIHSGYDTESPEFQAKLRPLEDKQAAFVVLKGVLNLAADTPGESDEDKVKAIMDEMPYRLVKFLAAEIWAMTYAQGNPADFFTKEDSETSPSSAPSESKSHGGRKQK